MITTNTFIWGILFMPNPVIQHFLNALNKFKNQMYIFKDQSII